MDFNVSRPQLQLYPYLRNRAADLYNHGFCIVRQEYLADLGVDPNNGYQMELFRQACRNISNEKDQDLIIDTQSSPHIVICFAPKGHPGSLPGQYDEDEDGKGTYSREEAPYGIAPGEQTIDLLTRET